jgi:hypothetical protein
VAGRGLAAELGLSLGPVLGREQYHLTPAGPPTEVALDAALGRNLGLGGLLHRRPGPAAAGDAGEAAGHTPTR